ncbi:MAG TPA: hypothetical protein VMZ27_10010 [Candidatus Saccharimonadales bacterium]|nr:hypothetical protein [Candidatus Saccharimonadales bacterium]
MSDPSEMNEHVPAYQASEEIQRPEPWSHRWHDELGLRYHQAMAEKILRNPSLLEVARENLRRWAKSETEVAISEGRRKWLLLLEENDLHSIIMLMTDPTEAGHQLRQSTPFAGLLSEAEAQDILQELL